MNSVSSVIKRVCLARKAGRPAIKYRIQLIDDSLVEGSVEFMEKRLMASKKYHMTITSHLGFSSDKEAVDEFKSLRRKYFSEGISVAALLEDDFGNQGPVIACNVLYKESMSETEFRTDPMRLLDQTMADAKKHVDVLKTFNCADYINSLGFAVASDFQSQGIATELLMARAEVCRLTNNPVSANVFTGPRTQKAAARTGFQTLSELDLRKYRIGDRIVYPEADGWPTIKFMAQKYF
nr:PREDICTED: uncharacterized protein LOC109038654 [Bemisia tabaci]